MSGLRKWLHEKRLKFIPGPQAIGFESHLIQSALISPFSSESRPGCRRSGTPVRPAGVAGGIVSR